MLASAPWPSCPWHCRDFTSPAQGPSLGTSSCCTSGVPSLLPPRAVTVGTPRWQQWPLNPITQGWPLAARGRFQQGCSERREIRNP